MEVKLNYISAQSGLILVIERVVLEVVEAVLGSIRQVEHSLLIFYFEPAQIDIFDTTSTKACLVFD